MRFDFGLLAYQISATPSFSAAANGGSGSFVFERNYQLLKSCQAQNAYLCPPENRGSGHNEEYPQFLHHRS
jgi:hypothetical protein